jgi:hypothetical protein
VEIPTENLLKEFLLISKAMNFLIGEHQKVLIKLRREHLIRLLKKILIYLEAIFCFRQSIR